VLRPKKFRRLPLTENGHHPLVCRGIRGATTAPENTSEAILEATRELLTQIMVANDVRQEDIASVIFTTTVDLNAEYPALAARQMGWHDVALMCGHEMTVPGSLKQCIRVLIHWNTTHRNDEIQHVYLRDAVNLRPDRNVSFAK
jgi:chorismate mutase